MDKTFDVIVADPPWPYPKRRNLSSRFGLGASGHYALMSSEEILNLDVAKRHASKNCMLFLWATGPRLDLAIKTMAAWGFKYSTVAFTWIKSSRDAGREPGASNTLFPPSPARPYFGTGFYSKSNAEFCLLGYNGRPIKPATNLVSSVVISPRLRHSEKPDEVQHRIELMYPKQSKLEVFARRHRPGWWVWGLAMKGHPYELVS